MFDKLRAFREKRDEADRGFTLIELLVVVVIIGILIAIAIPLYLNYQKGAKDKSTQSDIRSAVTAYEQCYTDNNNTYPTDAAGTTHTASYTVDCNGVSETVNLSSGTHLTYQSADGSSFTLSAYNDGGKRGSGSPYTYNSTSGGVIQ